MREYRVRIDSLVRDGDISANIAMLPGDVLIIPESFF
jgi:polysaccharide export outer membrane protein